uniref:Uncharacterized protein n=1 Tax=Arundo donax TaxID=35708 RepID=A0A0A9FPL0_ARUDO
MQCKRADALQGDGCCRAGRMSQQGHGPPPCDRLRLRPDAAHTPPPHAATVPPAPQPRSPSLALLLMRRCRCSRSVLRLVRQPR